MGAPLSLAYAARYPEGVGRLILYGGFANGHQVASAKVRTAMVELVRAHWGLGSDVLADIFLPDGTAETKVRRDDRAIPYRLGRDLAARIPGARLVSLAGRSHWVYTGDAAAVVREILEFLGASRSGLPAKQAGGPPGTLTARQLQVAALVADGLTNRQIAGRLGIEERSAEGHVERIGQRLGVRSCTQIATWWASSHGD